MSGSIVFTQLPHLLLVRSFLLYLGYARPTRPNRAVGIVHDDGWKGLAHRVFVQTPRFLQGCISLQNYWSHGVPRSLLSRCNFSDRIY